MPTLNPGESWEPIVEYYNRRAAQGTGAAQAREIQIDDRVRMARNLALGFRAVHDAGYVIGDVNEKNVEVNRQNDNCHGGLRLLWLHRLCHRANFLQ